MKSNLSDEKNEKTSQRLVYFFLCFENNESFSY